MERLTEKVFGFVQLKACGNDFCKETCAEHDEEKSCKNCPIQKAFEKLAEYEELEDRGLLLPCKVGDTLYAIGFNNNKPVVYESVVLNILIAEKEIAFHVKIDEFEINSQLKQSMFGKTVFLTKAEAEQKLKEMENGEDNEG